MRDPITAQTIAVLCGGLPIDEATALIEQYAKMKAAHATCEAVRETWERVQATLGTTEALLVPHA